MPTVYYYKYDKYNSSKKTAGLGSQIIERLDEMRGLFSVLSYIEAKADVGKNAPVMPSVEDLQSMDIRVRHQKDIEAELARLSMKDASFVFRLLNTDRVSAWNLVDFVEIMLSLYQTTDSTIEDAPLAFFHQREWRLVHHMMDGLVWFGLGNHFGGRDPFAQHFRDEKHKISEWVKKIFSQRLKEIEKEKKEKYIEWVFNHSWVLTGTQELHFRDFVHEIVAPEDYCQKVQQLVDSLPFYSSPPKITPLPQKWRITTENNVPHIVFPSNSESQYSQK